MSIDTNRRPSTAQWEGSTTVPHHSTAIANEFLNLANAESQPLTQMQLQKLVYIAHGWCLELIDRPLTEDKIEAWQYGPVYEDLWEALRRYGRDPVNEPIKVGDYGWNFLGPDADKVAIAELDNDERALIEKVFESYGKYQAFKLSALTHKPGTPWSEVYGDGRGHRQPIDNQLIRQHFATLRREREQDKAPAA